MRNKMMSAIVVVGASAGGLTPLRHITEPRNCLASVFVIVHIGKIPSSLPEILSWHGKMPVGFAKAGEAIEPGHIYVAPPDAHILITDKHLHLNHGPLVHGIPFDAPARSHQTTDFAAEPLLQRRPPRNELEAQAIIDHGEATGSERDSLPIAAGDVLALGRGPVHQAGLSPESSRCLVQLLPFQPIEEIAREDDTQALSPSQTLLDEVIDPPIHRCAHFSTERAAANWRVSCQQLSIDPRRSRRSHLSFDREIRPRRER
jgi:CheB methylesterase